MTALALSGMRVSGGAPVDLRISDGRVAEDAGPGPVLTAESGVIAPAFVDAHVHLDKAHLLWDADLSDRAGVDAAIDSMRRLRSHPASSALVADGAVRALRSLSAQGVVAARAHVEVDAELGLDLLDLHTRLREEWSGRLDLQLSVFPQHGIDSRVAGLLEQGLKNGADLVGACPYVDADPIGHLDTVFDIAQRHGCEIDLHLDFDDDASGSLIGAVVERTIASGMQGQVTIGHVTKLAAMTPETQARSFEALARADIALVVMPATDLFLCGGGDPGTRSLAPFERAAHAGVRVAISNNNLHNPFSPYGNGSLLTAAWAAGLVRRLVRVEDRELLLAAITHQPAAILGRERHGLGTGDLADLVLLDTDDPRDLVLQAPAVLATVSAGVLVYRRREAALVGGMVR